jgi:hypothetical protein
MIVTRPEIKILDEVFIAAALLHREHPEKQDFTISEIIARAEAENPAGKLRPAFRAYVSSHAVANRPPSPNRYAILYATGERTRRLLVEGDHIYPGRTGRTFPNRENLPPRYRELIDWARNRYSVGGSGPVPWLDGVLQMFGTGGELWRGEDPDEYVRRIREGWE